MTANTRFKCLACGNLYANWRDAQHCCDSCPITIPPFSAIEPRGRCSHEPEEKRNRLYQPPRMEYQLFKGANMWRLQVDAIGEEGVKMALCSDTGLMIWCEYYRIPYSEFVPDFIELRKRLTKDALPPWMQHMSRGIVGL